MKMDLEFFHYYPFYTQITDWFAFFIRLTFMAANRQSFISERFGFNLATKIWAVILLNPPTCLGDIMRIYSYLKFIYKSPSGDKRLAIVN